MQKSSTFTALYQTLQDFGKVFCFLMLFYWYFDRDEDWSDQDSDEAIAYHFPEEMDLSAVSSDEHIDDSGLIESLRSKFRSRR